MIYRHNFYDSVRASLFGGKMTALQVEGMEAILVYYEDKSGWTDIRWLSYLLATIYHETGRRFQPVKEFGSEAYLKSKKYYPYIGRDLLQTTWLTNYQKVKNFTGVDVVTHPELIANLSTAVAVAFKFTQEGWYTGKKWADYFNATKEDWINARRAINGLDAAEKIKGYALKFLAALT